MKLDHEKQFTGYVYINNKYQKLQDKCCLKSIFNLEIYPAMTAFTDQYSLPNIFFDIGQL